MSRFTNTSPEAREAARVMVERFTELLQRPHTQSDVDQAIDQFVDAARKATAERASVSAWNFLAEFCRLSFQLMKRGEDPGQMLSHIPANNGESDKTDKQ